MSTRRSSSRRTATTLAALPSLPAGIQAGLQRLVDQHAATVARMLDVNDDDNTTALLTEKCAAVMKQQQLSASQFLARFFDLQVLQQQAALYAKSPKGTAAVLAERIETAWRKNVLPAKATTCKEKHAAVAQKKRPVPEDDASSQIVDALPKAAAAAAAADNDDDDDDSLPIPKKPKKNKKSSMPTD